jgi:hypothetical protein
MSKKLSEVESPAIALKNDSSRQRWELFHRAIAHAKESNQASLEDCDSHASESDPAGPFLSIVR